MIRASSAWEKGVKRRCERAAATPWRGRPFVRGNSEREELETEWVAGRRGLQEAGRDARIPWGFGGPQGPPLEETTGC